MAHHLIFVDVGCGDRMVQKMRQIETGGGGVTKTKILLDDENIYILVPFEKKVIGKKKKNGGRGGLDKQKSKTKKV